MKLIISERSKSALTHNDDSSIEYYKKCQEILDNNEKFHAVEIFDLFARVYSELYMPPLYYEDVFQYVLGVSLHEYSAKTRKQSQY